MTKKQGLRLVCFTLVLGVVLWAVISVFGMPTDKDTALGVMKRYNDFYDVNLSLLKDLKNNNTIKLWLNDCLLNRESIPEEIFTDLQSSISNLNPPRE